MRSDEAARLTGEFGLKQAEPSGTLRYSKVFLVSVSPTALILDQRPGPMDQLPTQVAIAALAQAEQPILAAARSLPFRRRLR
jgi:hypothetical protein